MPPLLTVRGNGAWACFHANGMDMMDARLAGDVIAKSPGLLVDWDGCLALDNRPGDAAISFLREHGSRVAILSNNSTLLPGDFVGILAAHGVPFPEHRILLAGVEALQCAAETAPASVMILGAARMRDHAAHLGLRIVEKDAEVVVLLRDTELTLGRIEHAVNTLEAGARLIVANPDLTHPGPDGRLVPETGAILASLLACVNVPPSQMQIVGKPDPRMFMKACAILGISPGKAIMIGDNPATDIDGANAAGLGAILVKGRFGEGFVSFCAPAGSR